MPPGNQLESQVSWLIIPVVIDVIGCCSNESIPVTFRSPDVVNQTKLSLVHLNKNDSNQIRHWIKSNKTWWDIKRLDWKRLTLTALMAFSCKAEYKITDCWAAQVLDRTTAPRFTEWKAARRAGSSNRAHGSACRTIHMTRIMFKRSTVKVGPLMNADKIPLSLGSLAICSCFCL